MAPVKSGQIKSQLIFISMVARPESIISHRLGAWELAVVRVSGCGECVVVLLLVDSDILSDCSDRLTVLSAV